MLNNLDFVSLHAYLCSDGYVVRNPEIQKHKYYRVALRNTNIVLLKDFQNKFYRFFKVKPYIYRDELCRISSKEIYFILSNKFGSFYSNKWKLPNLSKNKLGIWLRSYFDCEAWVICRKAKDRDIGLQCINKKGIYSIKNALLKLEIKSKLKYRKDRSIWQLNIYGKENLIKFQKEVNFLHPDKRKKLQECIDSYVLL